MTTLTTHEQQEIDRANDSGLQPVVFVHGLWLLSGSWDRWRPLFEEQGYTTLAPGWPDDPDTVEEAKQDPEVFAHKRIKQVTDHYVDAIRRLKETLSIPVSGNGDILTPSDALSLWRQTGCDGVMIGRGALQNPWIFRQTAAALRGEEAQPVTIKDRREMILGHFRLLREQEEERFALHKIRTFTGWYTHGLPNGKHLRQRISSLATVDAFLSEVEAFFDSFPDSLAA